MCGKSTFHTQNDIDSANFRNTANKKYRSYHVKNVATRSCVKIRFTALDMKYTILSAVHRKLALSVSFFVRKVGFPALGRLNFKCVENQLSARKTTSSRLTFGIQQTKIIVNITCGTTRLALALKYAFLHLIRNILF